MSSQTNTNSSFLRVFRVRNFRLLWVGQVTSLLGSQFSFIALPWLVLQLTNNPLALGTVMALSGIPRVAVMLLGGAIADRLSPRRILVVADLISFVLTLVLVVLMLTDAIQLWMLYISSLVFGIIGGVVYPAATAIVPALLPAEDLQTGNALTQGNSQLSNLIGPVLAGSLIAAFSPVAGPARLGLALAFGIDAASFAVSALMLALIKLGARSAPASNAEPVFAAIRAGVRFIWQKASLRSLFGLLSITNLLVTGPLLVGIPVLANTRLPEGAAAFGIIMSAYGGGNVLGIVLAGALPSLSTRLMAWVIVGVLAGFGLAFLSFGGIMVTWLAALVLLVVGVGNGYLGILMMTQLQRRAPPAMMGRVMSLFMFCMISLTPLSQVLAGALSQWSLTGLFIIAGGLMLGVSVWIGLDARTRTNLLEMSGQPAEAA